MVPILSSGGLPFGRALPRPAAEFTEKSYTSAAHLAP
jgi:hypothetical protein